MATDNRCWGCCQENCGYSRCTCSCHGPGPKEKDCPRGVHVAELYRCTLGDPSSAEYWCMYCGVKTDEEGKPLSEPKWSIADRYFYQAGPLPEDRYSSKAVADKIEASEDRKAFDMLDHKCPCKKHRTYKAIRKPTTGCEECWRFYVRLHP